MLRLLILVGCLFTSGCSLLPDIAHQPTLHNPFPQLTRVAVAPFFNLSDESTLDGREVAMAYFNELQLVPGFEVVPVNVVERAIQDNNIALASPGDARRLAQLLGTDAVIIGAVTDYSPYYPPRCGLQVEWYSANPQFHPIPPGYGLPWGTPEEQQIPAPLVFEAELALAKAQLKTQTPPYEKLPEKPRSQTPASTSEDGPRGRPAPPSDAAKPERDGEVALLSGEFEVEHVVSPEPLGLQKSMVPGAGLPENWPDPRGFIPPPPSPQPHAGSPTEEPVIRHTRTYNGHDTEFTEALASYYYFRDDARFGGWQGYLQRSDDFLRFCCHMHIAETLSARGGAGETRVGWRWPTIR